MATLHNRFLAALAILVLLACGIPASAQNASPKIQRASSAEVKSTTALLTMSYDAAGYPSHGWFDIATNSSMTGAKEYAYRENGPNTGWTGFNAWIDHLAPSTTYYFRGVISTPSGKAVSSVMSFTTAAAVAPAPPTIAFMSNGYDVRDRVLHLRCSFKVDAKGVSGTQYLLWSTRADMSGAQRAEQRAVRQLSVADEYHAYVNISNLADGTVVYFQGVVETTGGTARTVVKSITISNKPY